MRSNQIDKSDATDTFLPPLVSPLLLSSPLLALLYLMPTASRLRLSDFWRRRDGGDGGMAASEG